MNKEIWVVIVFGVVLILFLSSCIERVLFLKNAVRVNGTVLSITGTEGTCVDYRRPRYRAGEKRIRFDSCTKFVATVGYTSPNNARSTFIVEAGQRRGIEQPIKYASLIVGERVQAIYDSRDPARVYKDTLWGVWDVPIMIFIVFIVGVISYVVPNVIHRDHAI